ncbi:MAG: alpha/beta hydrolase [Saprospirales bacterium]|nr:alpha/beta hydrolase [Saprospirales bacterium]
MGSSNEKRFSPKTDTKGDLWLELYTPATDERPVCIVGNFNNWQIDLERFQLGQLGPGHFQFRFPEAQLPAFPLEYKYVKGSWEDEESDEYGSTIPNRRIDRAESRVIDHVPRWKFKGLAYNPEFLPKIQVISEQFEIPQLIKTRRIAALLPHDYHETDKCYPVLYLQDGQNLFDDFAPFGNWAVDKKLAVMAEKGIADIIIISIDHAAEERVAEFTPSYQTRLGVGDGKKYTRFLADTLKPFVDQHFRTLTDRTHTGIGGSSMGGLISIYAGLMYPEVYGRLMVFSPSLWVAPNIPDFGLPFDDPLPAKIYIYAGGKEGSSMIPNINRYRNALERKGMNMSHIDFRTSIDPEGTHSEEHWGREFPKALEWLFF